MSGRHTLVDRLRDEIGPWERSILSEAANRIADLEQKLLWAQGQLGAEHAAHLATGRWLADTERQLQQTRHLLLTVLDAEQHFRNALPEEWGGDPIHEACEKARTVLEAHDRTND